MNQLWVNYFADRSEANKLAIFEHYTREKRLVIKVACSVLRRLPPSGMVTQEDLISAGDWALYRCIDRYDPDQGTKFSTFAGNRVRGAMLDWVRGADWVSRRGREAQREGVETPEMCSLDALTGWQDSGREDREPATEDLRQVMRHLNHLQRRVVSLLYLQGLTVESVSSRLGMTSARVSAIRAEIISRVQAAAGNTRRASQQCSA